MNAVSRVALVGHCDLIKNGLEHILARCPEFKVVAETETGLADTAPDVPGFEFPEPDDMPVILLGLASVPGRAGEDFEASIFALSEVGRVLVVGEFPEPRRLSGAIRAGAFGCLSGLVDEEELLLAVRTVARGGMHISPSLSALMHSELRGSQNPPPAILAPRESETLGWLAAGLTHREIAGRMGLTEATVSTYVKRIRSKLNARNKAELTRVAIELGLVDVQL